MTVTFERPLTIAMLALGGQGGGVLTNWLVDIAESNGYLAQSTYVAGVAQRTGATVYCVELFPRATVEETGKQPVFALYPVPGDVDLVITSELAESARAVQKGFVTPNISTLLSSTHRDYTMDEKIALGDGIADSQVFLDTASQAAREFICFDMRAAADQSNSIISAVILGGIAGTGVLPFTIENFEDAIRRAGRAVESNLAGFKAGLEGAQQGRVAENGPGKLSVEKKVEEAVVLGPVGEELRQIINEKLPESNRVMALHGALRALDYQDRAYAEQYVDTLVSWFELDRENGGEQRDFELTATITPQLALQMCYEDTIRVAELKTRIDRNEGIRSDVAAAEGQPAYVTEYFHPRFEELCDTLPAGLGRWALHSTLLKRISAPFLKKGKQINTSKITGFMSMWFLSKFKRWRRGTLRFSVQAALLDEWQERTREALSRDYQYAVALADSIRIVKGYGDTYERGLGRYTATLQAVSGLETDDPGGTVNRLIEAALKDEKGTAFELALSQLAPSQGKIAS